MAKDKDPDLLLVDPYRLSIRESQVRALKKFFGNVLRQENNELSEDELQAIEKLCTQLEKMP